jgi:hypothetical protein
VKRHGLDGGFKFQETQGVKRKEKDLSAIIFDSRVDGGLIPQKGRDSLAKEAAEMV